MIAYSIDAALTSGIFSRVVVSTDSEEIAAVAEKYGAEAPFSRSAEIADDMTPVSAVTVDVLERLDPEGHTYSAVAQLMANCPLRTADDLKASYSQFRSTGADSQISIVRYGWQNPWWAMRRDSGTYRLDPLFPREMTARSQDLPELFCPTGAIWWGKPAVIRQRKTFHIPERTGWEMPWQHAIDIDTPEDLQFAEAIFKMSQD